MLVAITVFASIAWVVALNIPPYDISRSDRLAETGDIIAGATLLLTVLAALVALRAYAVSTGLPTLKLQAIFPFSYPNRPIFQATKESNHLVRSVPFKQTMGTIIIRNEGKYSARNPAVIVRLHGMAFTPSQYDNKDWTVINFATTLGITEGSPGLSGMRVFPACSANRVMSIGRSGA
jgi:hypothetical protein